MYPGDDSYQAALPPQRTQRLLAANLPDWLFDLLVQALHEHPQFELVGHVHGQLAILAAAAVGVDLLILGATTAQPLPGICTHLLHEFPHLKLIVSSDDGATAVLYWLSLQQVELAGVAAPSLGKLLQRATQLHMGF